MFSFHQPRRQKDEASDLQTFTNFVEVALNVYDRCLKFPVVRELIMQAEAPAGSSARHLRKRSLNHICQEKWSKNTPWDSVYKLETLYRKCSTAMGKADTGDCLHRMVWVLRAVFFLVSHDKMQRTALSVRNWSGKGCPGNKGTLDLLLFKYTVSFYIMDFIESASIGSKEKSKMREIFKDHESFVGAYGVPGDDEHDCSWLGTFCETSRLACKLVQARRGISVHL